MRWVLISVLIAHLTSASDRVPVPDFIANNPMYKAMRQVDKQKLASYAYDRGERRTTIIYLFSSSVPQQSFLRHIESLHRLLSLDLGVQGVQFVRGIDQGYFPFLQTIQEDANQSFTTHYEAIRIKPNEALFTDLNITAVPVLLIASCTRDILHDCNHRFIIRGDITLEAALDIAAEKDREISILADALRGVQ